MGQNTEVNDSRPNRSPRVEMIAGARAVTLRVAPAPEW